MRNRTSPARAENAMLEVTPTQRHRRVRRPARTRLQTPLSRRIWGIRTYRQQMQILRTRAMDQQATHPVLRNSIFPVNHLRHRHRPYIRPDHPILPGYPKHPRGHPARLRVITIHINTVNQRHNLYDLQAHHPTPTRHMAATLLLQRRPFSTLGHPLR